MSTNSTYTRLAHRRSVLQHLQRLLREKYIKTDSTPREDILCEEVPFSDRFVSQEALVDVLDVLQQMEKAELDHMGRFELREKDVPALKLPAPTKTETKNAEEAVPGKKEAPGRFKAGRKGPFGGKVERSEPAPAGEHSEPGGEASGTG
jgi:hypothetical protein